MTAIGSRADRAAVAGAIISAAGNMLDSFGGDPESGYHDDIKHLDYATVAAIAADLLARLPGTAWDNRLPQPGTPA